MRLSKVIIRLAVSILAFGLLAAVPASAQTSSANAAQGLQISPTRVELNAVKGKTYTIKLSVMNVTASDLVYSSSVNDFNAKDETGSPNIVENSKLPATASIIAWMNPISRFTLKPRELRQITAEVTIPNNAEPGGHYGVLNFSGTAPELEGTGVALAARTGLVILIRVDGAISEKAELASFYSANKNGKQSWFFENGPIKFITRIKNIGNIHVKPSGDIEVKDMFGGIVAKIPVNKVMSNVLPSSIRRFGDDNGTLDKAWMFGIYTANLTLGYGTTGQAITSTISFWVIPYKIIATVLFILITLIYVSKKLIRAYNKRIIEKAKNETKSKKTNSNKS